MVEDMELVMTVYQFLSSTFDVWWLYSVLRDMAGGMVVEKVVQAQEVIVVNMQCLAAFSQTCGFQIVDNQARTIFGNRSSFCSVKLTGPGECV